MDANERHQLNKETGIQKASDVMVTGGVEGIRPCSRLGDSLFAGRRRLLLLRAGGCRMLLLLLLGVRLGLLWLLLLLLLLLSLPVQRL